MKTESKLKLRKRTKTLVTARRLEVEYAPYIITMSSTPKRPPKTKENIIQSRHTDPKEKEFLDSPETQERKHKLLLKNFMTKQVGPTLRTSLMVLESNFPELKAIMASPWRKKKVKLIRKGKTMTSNLSQKKMINTHK